MRFVAAPARLALPAWVTSWLVRTITASATVTPGTRVRFGSGESAGLAGVRAAAAVPRQVRGSPDGHGRYSIGHRGTTGGASVDSAGYGRCGGRRPLSRTVARAPAAGTGAAGSGDAGSSARAARREPPAVRETAAAGTIGARRYASAGHAVMSPARRAAPTKRAKGSSTVNRYPKIAACAGGLGRSRPGHPGSHVSVRSPGGQYGERSDGRGCPVGRSGARPAGTCANRPKPCPRKFLKKKKKFSTQKPHTFLQKTPHNPRRHRRAEREAHVAAEARGALAAALARVDVEELAGHDDDLLVERGAEEAHAVVERRRQVGDRAPDVERAVGRAVGAHAEALQAGQQAIALLAEGGVDRLGLGDDVRVGRAAGWPRAAAASSRRRRGTSRRWRRASMTFARADGPGDAPAGVAPVLGQAVEDDDRIAVDVLDVARGALDRQLAGRPAAPDVVRVELVEEQRAVELARRGRPSGELVALRSACRSGCTGSTAAAPTARGRGPRGADRRR